MSRTSGEVDGMPDEDPRGEVDDLRDLDRRGRAGLRVREPGRGERDDRAAVHLLQDRIVRLRFQTVRDDEDVQVRGVDAMRQREEPRVRPDADERGRVERVDRRG